MVDETGPEVFLEAQAATLNPFELGGLVGSHGPFQFTAGMLDQLAKNAPGCPVFMDFDESWRCGEIVSARVVSGVLSVIARLNFRPPAYADHFIVPGFSIPSWGEAYPLGAWVGELRFGMLNTPADRSLSRARIVPGSAFL